MGAIAATKSDIEQMYGALVLGTRDYVRKNGFTDVVIGLSGGIDSALVAAIAVDALGADRMIALHFGLALTELGGHAVNAPILGAVLTLGRELVRGRRRRGDVRGRVRRGRCGWNDPSELRRPL